MTKIDDIDKKILRSLASDSRQSVEHVGREIGLSTTPTRRRVKRLEAEGVIRRYTVNLDMERTGYGLFLYIFIKLQSRDQNTLTAFEERIRELPEVATCSLVTGPHDYLLTIQTRDMKTYNQFLSSVLAELPGIFGIETSAVIRTVKDEVPVPY